MTLKPNNEKKLQDFSFQQYHRPNDPTVEIPSGLAKPWPIRENGTWDLSEEEPTLTRPSLRRRRTVLTACVIAFTIGSLLIIFSSPHSKEFLVPGPLHSSHAQLLAGQGADRCAACHSAGETSSTFGWIAHAFSGASDDHTQSQLCLDCHRASVNESFALNPHNVAPAELKKKSPFQNASFVSNLTMPPVSANHELRAARVIVNTKASKTLKP